MKKQSDDMMKKQIEIDKSPFEKQRTMLAPRDSPHLQTQVSQDMFEDFMRYAIQYNVEHHNPPKIKDGKKQHNKANPLKHIVNEFLNSHALERKCFKNLHVIMLLSNPFDYNMRKSAVIGFVDHPEKFTKFRPFNVSSQRNYDTGLVYVLEEFDKQNFDMLNLAGFDREVLFNISPSIYDDFDKVREHLQGLYDLDFDNAFIVMFNLNNYFDIMQDGVFNSETSKDKHEGVIVLLDPFYKLERLIVRITWSYHDNALDIEFRVEDEGFFNMTLSSYLPRDVYVEYWSITSGFMQADMSKLEMDLKHSKTRVNDFKSAIELEERKQKRIIKKLDELKQ